MPKRKRRANDLGGLRYNKTRKRWEATLTVESKVVGYDEVTLPDGTLKQRPRYRQVRRTVVGPTQAVALARLDELRKSLDDDRVAMPADITVAHFLDRWISDVLPLSDIKQTTREGYERIARLYVIPHIGKVRLNSLTAAHVLRMLNKLKAAGLSPNTQRLARSVLRRALRSAKVTFKLIDGNPAADVDGVKQNHRAGRTLTPEQARALLGAADGTELHALVTVLLSLGLRKGEALGLSWSDLKLDAVPATVEVKHSLKKAANGAQYLDEPKTDESSRTIHLPAPVVDVLRRHSATQAVQRLAFGEGWGREWADHDLVFTSSIGTPLDPDRVNRDVQALARLAGLGKWTPHELRHSAASILLAQGVPLKVVSETLGHSSIRVTADVYGHLMEPAKAEAADAMTSALWG